MIKLEKSLGGIKLMEALPDVAVSFFLFFSLYV